jgi:hypothetical protein
MTKNEINSFETRAKNAFLWVMLQREYVDGTQLRFHSLYKRRINIILLPSNEIKWIKESNGIYLVIS